MPRYVRGGQRVSRVRAAVRWAVSTTTEGSPAITRTWAAKRARDHEQARALCLYCKQWSADVSTTFDPDVAAMCFHRLGAAVVSVCWSAWFHRRRVASTIMQQWWLAVVGGGPLSAGLRVGLLYALTRTMPSAASRTRGLHTL
jgi:hypothetical protein